MASTKAINQTEQRFKRTKNIIIINNFGDDKLLKKKLRLFFYLLISFDM